MSNNIPSSPPSDPQREKALFLDALDLPGPGPREAFLDHACKGDPELRRRIDHLLALHQPAARFFEPPPPSDGTGDASANEDLSAAGVRIGPYQLQRRLGEGGCGVVYMAAQLEPVRRHVALKIIRPGLNSATMVARFEMERQALALMDHPNIPRVLEAGATESGLPYFVMEWVQGPRVTDYCGQHRLDVRQRLALFLSVCHAVQHAHQKGVIHRDIKPSNILVPLHDGKPQPKLIDFGIATPTDKTAPSFAGTPAYMSPEQAEATDIDTRGDIYSLGVLLAELLVGRPPFDQPPPPADAPPDILRRYLQERQVIPLSVLYAALPAEERQRVAGLCATPPRQLTATLRNDLDHIVLKALQPDRRERYETANALAADIQRWLDHEPVSAHLHSRRYRLGKLIRRNRGVWIAGTLIALALIAGVGTSTWLFLRERAALNEQTRLRAEAEQARLTEARLRQQSEARGKISQAAVLLSHNDLAGADDLLGNFPLDLIPPSLECAQVMRDLGRWHAFAGRWDRAAPRFAALGRAITSADSADTDDISRDLLGVAAVVCQAGDISGYEQFRTLALARFAGTANPIVAEQIIKICLLRPAPASFLQKLEPLAKIVTHQLSAAGPQADRDHYMSAWRSLSIGLLEYRKGDRVSATSWLRRCLSYGDDNPARRAAALALLALSLPPGQEASAALSESRALVEKRFATPLDNGGNHQGFWFDWLDARLLLQQASAQAVDDTK